jgi:hypothetical protein
MIDLTTDAKNNIKKREPIIPLSPCIMYMYKYTVWAIPIPNFNCPFIIPKEKKQFHDNNNNNIISTKNNVHCTTLKRCI